DSDEEPSRKRHKARPSTGSLRGGVIGTGSPQLKQHAFSNLQQDSKNRELESQPAKTSGKAPLEVIVDNNTLARKPLQTRPAQDPDEMDEDVRKRNRGRVKEAKIDVVTISDSQDETEPSTTQES